MKHLLYLCFAAALLFVACKKDDDEAPPNSSANTPTPPPPEPCAQFDYGWIRVTNVSANPYRFYIDNVLKATVQGGTQSASISIQQGNGRALYAVQVSGYLLYPTERYASLNVVECSHYTWSIP